MLRSAAEPAQPDDPGYRALATAATAVVGVKVKALPNARSNDTLGEERNGSGILIRDDGLILTIGYLIMEADQVEVTDSFGTTVPASIVAYDHATGFGLLKALGKLSPKPIRRARNRLPAMEPARASRSLPPPRLPMRAARNRSVRSQSASPARSERLSTIRSMARS